MHHTHQRSIYHSPSWAKCCSFLISEFCKTNSTERFYFIQELCVGATIVVGTPKLGGATHFGIAVLKSRELFFRYENI
jgi:hypothetical protein